LDDEYLKERVVDIEDIARRVLRKMMKETTFSLSDIKEKVIIVAHDLSPSQTASLPKDKILGFSNEKSHMPGQMRNAKEL
jgi:phosphotransferase system enzyme I (PtsI)